MRKIYILLTAILIVSIANAHLPQTSINTTKASTIINNANKLAGDLNNGISKHSTLDLIPGDAGAISGPATVCKGITPVIYTVPVIDFATSYVWTLPNGTIDTTAVDSVSIILTNTDTSGTLSVYGINAAGNGTTSSLYITVNSSYTKTLNDTICHGDSVIVGPHVYKIQGTYIDILTALNGCDSTITTNLTVNEYPVVSFTATPTSGCAPLLVIFTNTTTPSTSTFKWKFGNGDSTNVANPSYTYNSSGTYTVKLTASNGKKCKITYTANSLITVNATPATPTITLSGNTLTSSATTGNQWYNATTGIISGATAQTYHPTANGYYYVIATVSGCISDSSIHYHYSTVGINVNEANNNLSIYPNPTKENLTIETNSNTQQRIEIINLIGQTIYTNIINKKATINTSAFANGLYILKLSSDKETVVRKFVKE